ncbi:MAG: NnrS family protein [Pseudomonadales bacterium]
MIDSKRRLPFANEMFFPAAALYGAFAASAWVIGLPSDMGCLPGLCTPAGHAHEMLFGYALAVVTGFLLGPQPRWIAVILLLLWIGSRVTFLSWPGSWAAVVLTALFALGLCVTVIPRFAHSAKKWRNRSVVWIIAAIAVASIVSAAAHPPHLLTRSVQMVTLILLAGLMFFMGGRILAPAVGGHATRSGRRLDNRVQPTIEGAVLLCLLAALAGVLLTPHLPVDLTGIALIGAAGLTAVRLIRWRLWYCTDRPDLLVLALGYGWLAVGMGMLGATRFAVSPLPVGIHSLTIGALGTLTVTVMGRTRLLYRFRDANLAPEAHLAGLLMSGSALARIGWSSGLSLFGGDLLVLSAALWVLSCLLILTTLIRTLDVFPVADPET